MNSITQWAALSRSLRCVICNREQRPVPTVQQEENCSTGVLSMECQGAFHCNRLSYGCEERITAGQQPTSSGQHW